MTIRRFRQWLDEVRRRLLGGLAGAGPQAA